MAPRGEGLQIMVNVEFAFRDRSADDATGFALGRTNFNTGFALLWSGEADSAYGALLV